MRAQSSRRGLAIAIRAVIALAIPAVLICGCGHRADIKTFALVPKAMNNPFFDQARDGCKAAEKEIPGIECLYTGPAEHSEEEQVQIVEDLVTRRVDGIAVAPSNAPAMARAFQRAREAKIPVITWDSDLLPEDHALRATYIGTENKKLGVEQARALQNLKPAGGTICIQSGGAAAQNLNERMQGLRDTLSGHDSKEAPGERLEGAGGWTEVAGCPLYSNDDFMLAVQQMDDVLTKLPELDAFVATGAWPQVVDQAYRQMIHRNRERLDSKRTIVIVADTLPVQMALLREGLSHAQVGQRPREMGHRAMEVLRDLAAGKTVPDPIYTSLDVCTPETASTCLGGSPATP
jgi:ribose transport system substrate-binding protein